MAEGTGFNPLSWFGGGNTSKTPAKTENTDDKNNNGDNKTPAPSFWQTPKPETKEEDTKNVKSADDIEKEVQGYFNKFNFTNPLDLQQLENAFKEGDVTKVEAKFQEFGRHIMQETLGQVSKFVDTKIKDAVTEAVSKATSSVKADGLVSEMHRELPFTSDKSLDPIARAVLKQAVTQGAPDNKAAIETVKQFFVAANKLSSADLGMDGVPPNGRSRPDVRGNQTDWGALLKGLSQEE